MKCERDKLLLCIIKWNNIWIINEVTIITVIIIIKRLKNQKIINEKE